MEVVSLYLDIKEALDEIQTRVIKKDDERFNRDDELSKANKQCAELSRIFKDFEIYCREIKDLNVRRDFLTKKEELYKRKECLQNMLDKENFCAKMNGGLNRVYELRRFGDAKPYGSDVETVNPEEKLEDCSSPPDRVSFYEESGRISDLTRNKILAGIVILLVLGCLIILGVYLSKIMV